MGDPNAPALQVAELVGLLDRHRVRYVVVGGLAGTVHGSARVTFDIDLVPEWTDENLDRLACALRECEAALYRKDEGAPVEVAIDSATLKGFEVSTWRTRLGDVDLVAGTPTSRRGTLAGYEALAGRAHRRDVFGVTILVADLDDVIESKQALAREADLVALPELYRLRDRLGD